MYLNEMGNMEISSARTTETDRYFHSNIYSVETHSSSMTMFSLCSNEERDITGREGLIRERFRLSILYVASTDSLAMRGARPIICASSLQIANAIHESRNVRIAACAGPGDRASHQRRPANRPASQEDDPGET